MNSRAEPASGDFTSPAVPAGPSLQETSMRKQHRYGDEETIVTLREKAVGILFVIGIAALLIGSVVAPYDDPPATATAQVVHSDAP